MPDIERKSISATQAPALFDASPYLTRWMLYRWFKFGDRIDSLEHNRMDWGKRMEPLCLAQAAEDLHLEVRPTRAADGTQPYLRNGLLGATRDAEIICPDRGPGALESKCVFDYGVWQRDWDGGKKPPRHVEIQLQMQMLTGTGESVLGAGDGVPFKWGTISAWCGAEQFYFERKPIPDLWAGMRAKAAEFFADLDAGREPDPFGAPMESDLLAEVFPAVIGKDLDLSKFEPGCKDFADALAIAEEVRLWKWHSTERLGHERAEKSYKAKMQAMAKECDRILLPYGIKVTVSQSPRAGFTVAPTVVTYVKPYVPDNLPEGDISIIQNTELGG